mmetsp:Transcript_13488/g.18468  ORF Transcript_13488/g.18468 Transcript_13488/m.18468 type:complete len:120 (+) Transcript_13488:75-434(+)
MVVPTTEDSNTTQQSANIEPNVDNLNLPIPPTPENNTIEPPAAIEVNDDAKKELTAIPRNRIRRKAIRPNSVEETILRDFIVNYQMENMTMDRTAETLGENVSSDEETTGNNKKPKLQD